MVSVREASAGDVPAILELLYELGRPRPGAASDADAFGDMIKGYIADDDKGILVATADGSEVAGVVAVMLLPRLNRTSLEMYVPELVVCRGSRRQGVGRELIDSCVRLARENGCHRIRLESGNSRISSHRFYEDLGFEQSSLSFTKDL